MKRIYEKLLDDHFSEYRQMAFISGPRQVGKTTLVKRSLPEARYLNYDAREDAQLILSGADNVAKALDLFSPENAAKGVIFDELHKSIRWKSFLKGFFDLYGDHKLKIAVTGSARLNTYKRGGDSMMGRYFLYRLHPFSMAELSSSPILPEQLFQESKEVDQETLNTLLKFGGYPEPFLNGTERFYQRWKNLRLEQLFNDDLRDLSKVQDIHAIRILSELLASRVGSGINYTSLSNELGITSDTVKAWILLLESIFFCYSIRPWYKNIANSIRKQPKIYLWDWSLINDAATKKENLVASHLLKAAHWWTDCGLGTFELFYIRDKRQREVDFLVTQDNKPLMLIECKSSSRDSMSEALLHYQQQLKVPYAFQVAFDKPASDLIPTEYKRAIKISVLDLLKILV